MKNKRNNHPVGKYCKSLVPLSSQTATLTVCRVHGFVMFWGEVTVTLVGGYGDRTRAHTQ
ncbi:hypothetical protein PAXRUDRAFT_827094 [Paxillus rubicundulus Ve08.2h10]|uniref:Uncharacterized protein n=1 Tax=Paxillus rubicundulus Ve08.2h10 TaxID=930991 RepID=A0A0D0DDJ3_9AGAM|nr:hypothetical protein PAXRUDRAFT_827094 [Paxillus rubicundulus Ve08.2h10]